MTSVDELFQKSGLPVGSAKRKLDAPDAQQVYKAAKLSSISSPNGHAHAASVDDGREDDEDDDVEAGPDLPPEDEDEDGRFFGNGISRDAADALDYIDEQDGDTFAEDSIDSAWLRRLITSFGRKVARNAELRAKYDDDPPKFMASEADLDSEIKNWSLLSEHPELYAELATSDAVQSFVGLVAHENTDIAISAIEILSELLDEDVQAEQGQWDALAAAFLEANMMELIMSNMARLDESNETDRGGVYHSLAVIDHLASQQAIAEKVGTSRVLLWLCERMSQPELPVGQNKQYAAEVLQVLLQSSRLLRRRLAEELDGVHLFLRMLSPYRTKDPPKGSHEEELVENIFDALTCVVDESVGKDEFVKDEGLDLCGILLNEGSRSIAQQALRILDHAVGGLGSSAAQVCEKLVDATLLKPIFTIFMKRTDDDSIEHILGISAALLRLLPGESAPRIRTLAKFAEKDYAKVARLSQLRTAYAQKVSSADQAIRHEQRMLSDDEITERTDEWFSRRLEAGLFCVQTIDTILAWLIAEDPGTVKPKVDKLIGNGTGLQMVRSSLEDLQSVGEGGDAGDEDTREMLETLLSFLP